MRPESAKAPGPRDEPQDDFPPASSPQAWLRFARADLALARAPLPPDGLWETLCFHAQQAAEKAIKGVLIHYGVDFPLTHVIERLIALLPAEVHRPATLLEAARLTVFATVTRYPGDYEPVTDAMDGEALGHAEAVVGRAEQILER